ncbi:hypothetical protein HYU50_03115 [Candidatus Woesearchaeota archaeon]|nr:hypothetical protein [Candidatus Woesearchaeota archaeon]
MEYAKIRDFFVKYWSYFLVLIPIFIVIYMRMQSANLTITDDWAATNVYNYYKASIKSQIMQQYPNIPESNLNSLVEQEFGKFASENKENINQQIKAVSQQLKDNYQYESGSKRYPYMGDIDSYYFLRQARNIVEKSHNCDVIENGICYDTYTLAPLKARLSQTIHPYFIVYLYKIIKPFNPDITLMQAQILVPTVLAVAIAIIVFFMMLRNFNLLAALTTSILVSVNPIFLSRSLGSDTDIYNVFFPVLVVFLIFESFRSENLKAKAIFAALAGIFIGAYSFSWNGWWYLFDFIIIAIIADFIFKTAKEYIKTKKFDLRETARSQNAIRTFSILAPFLIFSMIAVSLIIGFNSVLEAYRSPLSFVTVKAAAQQSLWPNVLTTVAEFNEASINEIIKQMGGRVFFFFAMLGFVLLFYKKLKNITSNIFLFLISIGLLYYLATKSATSSLAPVTYILVLGLPLILGIYMALRSEEDFDIKTAVLLFLWVSASIYAATKGVRFTLLLLPPIAIGIGIAFGFLHSKLTLLLAKALRIKWLISIVIFLFFAFYLIEPVKNGVNISKQYIPNVDDQWWNALTKIKESSKPDAIINSWWDFGHWFKYIADRRVTLDGSSQNNEQLHWLGKLLLTPDENEARGILRMLDCGGNKAFRDIDKKKDNAQKSIELVNKIILLKKKEDVEKMLLENGFSQAESNEILQYSHCEAPENFLITSEDMVGKSGVWSHFGSWNFGRAWMQKTFKNAKEKEEVIKSFIEQFGFSREEADSYYSQLENLKTESEINAWIAPWPGYAQGESGCENDNGTVKCGFQNVVVEINLTTMEARIPTSQGYLRPDVFGYTTPDSVEIKDYSENTIGIGMVLMITKDSYTSIFMSPQLVNSTFTKLYYLDGHGTSYFEPFHSSTGFNGFSIKIWKVNWEGRENRLIADRFNAAKFS